MHRAPTAVWIATLAAALAWSAQAQAQLVFIARHAIGRVQQMSQQQQESPSQQGNGGLAYDTAAVMVEVPADKVYAVALRNLGAQPQLRITSQDPQSRDIQFTNGTQIAGMQVNPMSQKLSQILITAAHSGNENVSAVIFDRILALCSEMKVKCSKE